MNHDSGDLATEYDGIIKSEVMVKIKLTKIEDGDHKFIFTLDDKSYELLTKTLDTGAPVWFAEGDEIMIDKQNNSGEKAIESPSPFVNIMQGDVLEQLRMLPSESVHCCVTSPPYWGLRDYGVVGQIGMEPTIEEYIIKMTEVFQEVRRVLRNDGTCWINMGDSYASGGYAPHNKGAAKDPANCPAGAGVSGLKQKDLVGQPWRLALALQAAGWYLRSDIIWSKPNPMPESCTDRPTKAHEYIFLMTKSARYFYDQEAVKEKTVYQDDRVRDREHTKLNHTPGRTHSCGLKTNNYEFRNLRTVWNINLQPYPEAHFATFPEEIPNRCIRAGCPAGGIVLDPFAGSGTTGAVARGLGRSCILIELNPEYVKLIEDRTDAKVQALTAFEVVL
jgi:DNA modification methylase